MSRRPALDLDAFWAGGVRAWPTGLAAALAALALHLATCSSLVSFSDPAELQTMAATGGIAHAGYPSFVAVLQAAGRWPWGSMAWRANAVTALLSAPAIGMLAWFAHRLWGRALPALVAALALACSISFWNEATLAGVHSPTLSVIAVLLALALRYAWRPSATLALSGGALAGLGLTGHLTVLGVLPALPLAMLFGWRRHGRRLAHLALAAAGLLVGLSPFAAMLADDTPEQPMNYIQDTLEPGEYRFAVERPDLGQRIERAVWLVSGHQYLSTDRRDLRTLALRALIVAGVLGLNDLPGAALPLALAGSVWLWRRSRGALRALLALHVAASLGAAFVGGTGLTLHYFILPVTWHLALGLAGGLQWLAERARPLGVAAMLLVLVTPFLRLRIAEPPGPLSRLPRMFHTVWGKAPAEWDPFHPPRRHDAYGRGVMARLPRGAEVLATRWDAATVLRYFCLAEPLRPDVVVSYAGSRDPRLTRLWRAARRAGRATFSTHPPDPGQLPEARAERVWDSGWKQLWALVPRDSGAASVAPPAGR